MHTWGTRRAEPGMHGSDLSYRLWSQLTIVGLMYWAIGWLVFVSVTRKRGVARADGFSDALQVYSLGVDSLSYLFRCWYYKNSSSDKTFNTSASPDINCDISECVTKSLVTKYCDSRLIPCSGGLNQERRGGCPILSTFRHFFFNCFGYFVLF